MVPPEAPYPEVYTDTFIFFLRPLCKIIWINVHYFPNAPRIMMKDVKKNILSLIHFFVISDHEIFARFDIIMLGVLCVNISKFISPDSFFGIFPLLPKNENFKNHVKK